MTSTTLTNGPLSCVLNSTGIVSITFGSALLTATPSPGVPAQGSYDSPVFPSTSVGPVTNRNLYMISGTAAEVSVFHPTLDETYVYSLNGTDLNITLTLYNESNQAINGLSVALPSFAVQPTGNLKSFPMSYLAADQKDSFHPGIWSPLAVAYAQTANGSIAFHSKSHFDKPSLFNSLNAGSTADMSFYVNDVVPAYGRLVVSITIHFSSTNDLPSVTSSYVRDFVSFAGPMQYSASDKRPWIQFSAISPSWITSTDPLGYGGPGHSLDNPTDVGLFEQMVSPLIGEAQGVLFWQPQGINSRGAAYREDFDCWPASVRSTLPSLFSWCSTNGYKVGLAAQPSLIVTSLNGSTDYTIQREGTNSAQIQALFLRFSNVSTAVGAYYFDSFGTDLNSYTIMKQLRPVLGSTVTTYSEYTSDLMLPYSGQYVSITNTSTGNVQWYDSSTMAIFDLLYPGRGVVAKGFGDNYPPVATAQQVAAWGYTPLIYDANSGNMKQWCGEFNSTVK